VDRATLVAFYIRGRTLKQMSREFETPIGTIKRRLHVARNRLKKVMEQAGTGPAGEDAELAGV
jgi:RNA polymerase sigma-70 factor (ECF subfamily)